MGKITPRPFRIARGNAGLIGAANMMNVQGRGANNAAAHAFTQRNNAQPGQASGPVQGGDPFWANVSLLMDFDGEADGSTTFTDLSSNALTCVPSVLGGEIDTAVAKFGDGSLLVNNGNRGVVVGDGGDSVFDFGSGAFTVEFDYIGGPEPGFYGAFMQFGDTWTSPDRVLWQVSYDPNLGADGQFQIAFSEDGLNFDLFRADSGDADLGSLGSAGFFDGNWHTVALVRRDNGDIWLYIDGNGKSMGSYTSTIATPTSNDFVSVGGAADRFKGMGLSTLGNYDNVRVTKGVARYTEPTYVLPSEAYLTS